MPSLAMMLTAGPYSPDHSKESLFSLSLSHAFSFQIKREEDTIDGRSRRARMIKMFIVFSSSLAQGLEKLLQTDFTISVVVSKGKNSLDFLVSESRCSQTD
jgi:hypothetical protein